MCKTMTMVSVLIVASLNSSLASAAQQLKPTFTHEQRVGLARKILEPTYEKAVADPQSDARKIAFLHHWATIDPAWTAKFILKNPMSGQVLWDNKTMLVLTSRASEIDEEVLLAILEQNAKHFVFYNYVERALLNIPPEKEALREKILKLALRTRDNDPESLQFLSSRLDIARSSGDAKAIEKAKANLRAFYESGKAEKLWLALIKQSKLRNSQQGFLKHQFAQVIANVPAGFNGTFDLPESQNEAVTILTILSSGMQEPGQPEDLKTLKSQQEKLGQIKRYSFGKMPHEYMRQAAELSRVAYVDAQIALKFASGAPNGHAKCYAWLSIAPALSLEDPESARKLIVDCYEEIANLPQGDRILPNYNHPPAIIAASGLPIVEFVAPDLLPECLKTTIDATVPMKASRLADSEANFFEVVAGIARYDRKAAKKLYDANGDQIDLHSAPGFFRAMVALYPEQVLEEFQLLPETDERNIHHQIQVRNAILPALLAKDATEYWTLLFGSHDIKLDPKIVARKNQLATEAKK